MKKIILILLLPFFIKAQSPGTDVSKKEAKELLESYRQRAIKGESFGTLAAQYSEDPGSAKSGGMYKNVARGVMVQEFETVAFSLKPNEISEVFETQYGFHFIQLISRRGEVIDVRHILVIPK